MPANKLWTEDWTTLQRRYWEHWTQLQQEALGVETTATAPWESAMNHWWEAVSGAMPDVSREFLENLISQGKSFFQMAGEFSKYLGTHDEQGWQKLVDNLVESFTRTSSAAGDSMKQATGFWEMPLDNWNRLVSALSPLPGDMLRGMPTTGFKENIDRILGAPGLGYTRESQEQYQSLFQALVEYHEALRDYSLFFSRMGENAAVRLADLVQSKPVESARQLYDSWIQCCEQEYADQVLTPEYSRLHGRMVNVLMQLKHRWGELLNEYLSALNVPTHDDLRTLQNRVQEHRREIRQLRNELAAIRKRIDASADASPTRSATPAPARKTAVRKTPASRKRATTKKA